MRRGGKKDYLAYKLRDWQGREVEVTKSLFTKHISCGHPESYQYEETFKSRFSNPDKVIKRSTKNEVEIVIYLSDRPHKYLIAYVKYGQRVFNLVGKNIVTTIYPTNEERTGEVIWPLQVS